MTIKRRLTYAEMVAVRPGDPDYALAMEQAFEAQALRGGPRFETKEVKDAEANKTE